MQWIKYLGGKQDDEAYSIVANRNMISVCGYFSDTVFACSKKFISKGKGDAFIWFLSSDGADKSFYTIGSIGQDEATSLEIINGTFFTCGFFEDTLINFPKITSRGNSDAFVAILSEDKGIENIKQFGGFGDDKLICSTQNKTGNLLFGGNYFTDSTNQEDNYVLQIDKNLNKILSFTIKQKGFNQINSIDQCADNIIISGEYIGKNDFNDAFIASLSAQGKLNWINTFSSPYHEWAKGLCVTDSLIYFASEVNDSAYISFNSGKIYRSVGNYDVYFGMLNQKGNLMKRLLIQGKGEDGVNKIIIKDGYMYFCGWIYDKILLFGKSAQSNGEGDLYIVKTNEFK